jgi:tripartite-type tricarboxylate transporter receptor subunit TctC
MNKTLCGALLLLAWGIWHSAASFAQTSPTGYPNKPITVVIGYPPGNTLDIAGRIAVGKVGQQWGRTIIVENRSGAAGGLGAEYVAKSPPNGHTVLFSDAGPMIINPIINTKLGYSPVDFQPVSLLAVAYYCLVVPKSLKVNDAAELIALAKTKPGELTFGSPGVGSISHLAMESFQKTAGISLSHVAYRGGAQTLAALANGELSMAYLGALSPSTVETNNLKILLVGNEKRIPLLADVPSTTEAGVKGLDFPGYLGLYAPAKTPSDIVATLAKQFSEAVVSADTTARLASVGIEPIGSTPTEFVAHLQAQRAKYSEIVQSAGVRLN